jgi:predicted nucleic-acid-binding protein
MIGFDTNILLRYLMADQPVQAGLVSEYVDALSEEDSGYISLVALAEVAWTLARRDGVSRRDLIAHLTRLTSISHVHLQCRDAVLDALDNFIEGSIDFPDNLIERTGHFDGCEVTVTFDRKASRTCGFRLMSETSVAAFRARLPSRCVES